MNLSKVFLIAGLLFSGLGFGVEDEADELYKKQVIVLSDFVQFMIEDSKKPKVGEYKRFMVELVIDLASVEAAEFVGLHVRDLPQEESPTSEQVQEFVSNLLKPDEVKEVRKAMKTKRSFRNVKEWLRNYTSIYAALPAEAETGVHSFEVRNSGAFEARSSRAYPSLKNISPRAHPTLQMFANLVASDQDSPSIEEAKFKEIRESVPTHPISVPIIPTHQDDDQPPLASTTRSAYVRLLGITVAAGGLGALAYYNYGGATEDLSETNTNHPLPELSEAESNALIKAMEAKVEKFFSTVDPNLLGVLARLHEAKAAGAPKGVVEGLERDLAEFKPSVKLLVKIKKYDALRKKIAALIAQTMMRMKP